ncbi:hypothetical protein GQ53DRAFT_751443 [Thozetella sp. PMI_491]|nr:hypothetical protein GQ53DRAFT_751443 [Thozetella sp. PMI_491]
MQSVVMMVRTAALQGLRGTACLSGETDMDEVDEMAAVRAEAAPRCPLSRGRESARLLAMWRFGCWGASAERQAGQAGQAMLRGDVFQLLASKAASRDNRPPPVISRWDRWMQAPATTPLQAQPPPRFPKLWVVRNACRHLSLFAHLDALGFYPRVPMNEPERRATG